MNRTKNEDEFAGISTDDRLLLRTIRGFNHKRKHGFLAKYIGEDKVNIDAKEFNEVKTE